MWCDPNIKGFISKIIPEFVLVSKVGLLTSVFFFILMHVFDEMTINKHIRFFLVRIFVRNKHTMTLVMITIHMRTLLTRRIEPLCPYFGPKIQDPMKI